ncbi:DUF1523 family protein [Epibacterium sp. SM1979]|uniref:DUF1523 family protein n=1 Tax=Tritonibacter litoralis TaxID=2662264 RepID=A0A843YP49_9RHOB|nr:DUF1523 family protein [Tritonibacter litoralis]MQQ10387.1 DUF1523 family protein [Tritonibacter litoralis]
MGYVRWGLTLVFWGLIAAFLHYTLPQNDIVRIVNTYEERQELNDWTRLFWSRPDAQTQNLTNRDVQFIQAVRPNGDAIVYRNEDTGWSWPPYFKFDTANLYTEANDAISTKDTPEWVAVRHYGWRNQFLSIFPNAVSLKPVAGPDVKVTNWHSIIILIVLAALFWAIYVRWRRFKARRVDPLVEDVEDNLFAVGDAVSERKASLMRWFKKK